MTSPAHDLVAAGNAAYRAGRFHEAIDLGRRAVAADGDNPWAHNLLGAACAEEMEFGEARRAFAAAVAAGPEIAISRINHAYALILDGEFAAAEAELRTALALEPMSGPAFLNLSWIHKACAGDPLIERLEEARRRSADSSDPQARVQYAFALGKLYDDIGEHDRAFACFREGNDLSQVACDIEGHVRRTAAIKSIFSRDFVREARRHGHKGDKFVFIVGMPRSGSSLLEDRLARHPLIGALGERPDVGRIVGLISANHPLGKKYPDWAPELPRPAFARFGGHYAASMEAKFPAAARLIDKNLLNFRFLGMIAGMLPEARVLHCRRNPVDTCLSCYFQLLRPDHDYKFDLAALGRYYRLYADLMTHWEEAVGDIAAFDYETFVENTDGEYARALAVLGLDDAPTAAAAAPRSIQTSSAFQVRQPITRASSGRWRNYERHLGPLIDALGDLARS